MIDSIVARDPVTAIPPRVQAELDSLGVPYEVVEIDPAHADTVTFCEK